MSKRNEPIGHWLTRTWL